ATTRPETILGDTAVAVHPEDERYGKFVGKMAVVPMLGREIPVIADDYVDREFGTGALKITPGHDPHDYEIGERHGLAIISMLDKEAHVNQTGGPYAGMDRFDARKKLWEDMRTAGLVIKEEHYTLKVPRSQRGGEIIEPMISTQWFIKIEPLAKAALEAVKDGRITIVPEHFTKVYYNWMENIVDWCISRQLWWGHRIPIWYGPDEHHFAARSEEEAHEKARAHYGEDVELVQDPDVLDTWFSSGLWPFSTLGWPDETPDFKYFYPTTMMETGYDILFFWVARMIMSGLEYTGEVPFTEVYLHGLIRDEQGRKMSKSIGNVIDPLVVMNEMGTDALRFTLLVGSTPGNDMNLSLKKVEANRNFANKVWNAARLILGSLEKAPKASEQAPDWTLADLWIHARLRIVVRDVERLFQNYQYGEAGRQIYEFFWSEFADWYLEIAKLQLDEGGDRAFYTAQTMVETLDTCLRMLHPFTPFVTEELWGYLKQAAQAHSPDLAPKAGWEDALIVAKWPQPKEERVWEADAITGFTLVMDIIRAIRNLRSEKNVKPGLRIPAILVGEVTTCVLEEQAAAIAALSYLNEDELQIVETLAEKPEGHVALVVGPVEIFLPLAEMVDPAEERARLEKSLAEAESQVARLEKLLASPFAEKAPAAVVDKEREKLFDFQESAKKIKSQLESL
ncbi:MAG: valine--tRNA ligase, partial [Anaerolineales bacterium]|nr:valine--tRNA ligase [Anaerolineales bacterium]